MQIEEETYIDLKVYFKKAYRKVIKRKKKLDSNISPVAANCVGQIDDSVLLTAITKYHDDFHKQPLRQKDERLAEVTWVTLNLLQYFINRTLQQYNLHDQPGADVVATKKEIASLTHTLSVIFNSLCDRLITRHLLDLTLINQLASYPDIPVTLEKIDTLKWNRLGALPFDKASPLRLTTNFNNVLSPLKNGDFVVKNKNFSGLDISCLGDAIRMGTTFEDCNFNSSYTCALIDLQFITFIRCDLRRSRLFANLIDVKFRDCNLEGADFSKTNLQNINNDSCSNTIDITNCITKNVIYNIDRTDEKFRVIFKSSGNDLGFSESSQQDSQSLSAFKAYLTLPRENFFAMYCINPLMDAPYGINLYRALADQNSTIEGFNFSGLKINMSQFDEITFQNCRFDGAAFVIDRNFQEIKFINCSLQLAIFEPIHINSHSSEKFTLSYIDCNMYKIKAQSVSFDNTTLTNTNLSYADLTSAQFRNASLNNVNLDNARIGSIIFEGATVANCSFIKCKGKVKTIAETKFYNCIFPESNNHLPLMTLPPKKKKKIEYSISFFNNHEDSPSHFPIDYEEEPGSDLDTHSSDPSNHPSIQIKR